MLKINQRIAFKSISGSVFLLAIFSVIVCVIGYNSYTASLMKTYSDGAFQTAEQAAAIVNGNRAPQYAASGGEGAVYHSDMNTSVCVNNRMEIFDYIRGHPPFKDLLRNA